MCYILVILFAPEEVKVTRDYQCKKDIKIRTVLAERANAENVNFVKQIWEKHVVYIIEVRAGP